MLLHMDIFVYVCIVRAHVNHMQNASQLYMFITLYNPRLASYWQYVHICTGKLHVIQLASCRYTCMYISQWLCLSHIYRHESSEGSSSIINPKPMELNHPSACSDTLTCTCISHAKGRAT